MMKVYVRNQQKSIRVSPRRVTSLLRKALQRLDLTEAELSVLFVNDKRMRMLNRQYRGMDKTTDVLSFPQAADFPARSSRFTARDFMLGDIVINLQKAKR